MTVPVRPASTVLAMRQAGAGFEVLMVRRAGESAFMGGAYVFPGGAVDAGDHGPAARSAVVPAHPELHPWWAAALRELAEEAGVFVTSPPLADPAALAGLHGAPLYAAVARAGCRFAGDRLAYFSNWVTPPGPPRRFDTRFFVVEVAAGTAAVADGREVTDLAWVAPSDALARGDAGDWYVPFPTRRHLEQLAGFPSAGAVVEHARSLREVPRVDPRVVETGEGYRILLPGDDGYEAALPARRT